MRHVWGEDTRVRRPWQWSRCAERGHRSVHMAEVTLFPPLARFFIGLLLILIIEGSAVLFALYLHSKY